MATGLHQGVQYRVLYLPVGGTIDLAAAKATTNTLCQAATLDDLRILFREEWIDWDTLPDSDDWPVDLPVNWSDEGFAPLAGVLRAGAEQTLHRRLDRLAASLHQSDVTRCRINGGDGGVDVYLTGGLDTDYDNPTHAYECWDVVCADEPGRFPDRWPGQIGAAAGLLRPNGPGPAALTFTVTFHPWA